MLADYPQAQDALVDADAEADIEWLKGVITAVRNIRAEMNIGPAKELELLLHNGNDQDFQRADDNQAFLMKMAKLSKITWLIEGEQLSMVSTDVVGQLEEVDDKAGV